MNSFTVCNFVVFITNVIFGTRNIIYAVEIDKDLFGAISDVKKNISENIYQYTLKNDQCVVQILTYGATIRSISVPDKFGQFEDIVLGFDDINGYINDENPYFGATVGRVANRIANASFSIDGITYQLDKNEGNNTLHGGFHGFNKGIWDAFVVQDEDELVMHYISEDGEGGFPGPTKTFVTFKLFSNQFSIRYFTRTNKTTPINLTNHAYFNLAGQGSGHKAIFDHTVEINAKTFTVFNSQSLPTGEIKNVSKTKYDLRKPQLLGTVINSEVPAGFDINYVLKKVAIDESLPQFAAKLAHPPSGRELIMCTDQPCLQLCTANSLSNVGGKNGVLYEKFGGVCLKAQKYPDAVHHDNFPSTMIRYLEPYYQTTVYHFGVNK